MTDQPPPPGNYPPPEGGYPPPSPPQQGGFPPAGGEYPPPPAPGGFPPAPGGFPPAPPQGGFPPAPGGFPSAPQQGGFPPPPPTPGAGYPPPPPPHGAGYPPPPPPGAPGGYPAPGYPGGPGYGAAPYSVGEAFSWAWNKFSKNWVPLVVSSLIYGVIVSVISGVMYALAFSMADSSETSYSSYGASASVEFGAGSMAVFLIGSLLLLLVGGAIASAYTSGMLAIANGEPVEIGSFFKPRSVGSVILATLVIGIAVGIGSLLCILPGLVISLFATFAVIALLDRNLAPFDAISTSFNTVKNNLGPSALAWLVAGVIMAIGSMCYVGLLVALPVAQLLLIFTWRRLTGGQVAPLTP